mmetsp:Transcript_99580/g.277224  ORF Transcript_99580/g.277224 Transcript_99580/m.277224 type:complete len:134 (+) Transcript_99580:1306-1707(+)
MARDPLLTVVSMFSLSVVVEVAREPNALVMVDVVQRVLVVLRVAPLVCGVCLLCCCEGVQADILGRTGKWRHVLDVAVELARDPNAVAVVYVVQVSGARAWAREQQGEERPRSHLRGRQEDAGHRPTVLEPPA